MQKLRIGLALIVPGTVAAALTPLRDLGAGSGSRNVRGGAVRRGCHGADARRRPSRHRCVSARAGRRAGRRTAAGAPAAHTLRQARTRPRRTVAVLRRARLRGGPAGHAGTVRIGGHVLEVPRPRCPGRLRHGRVGRRASLHVGRRRHVRHLLRRAHAGGRGQDEPAAPAGAAAQPGRHLPAVGAQGPQPRRVRAGPAARLGVRPAPRLARPGGASHVRGGGGGRLVRGDAPAAGPQPPRRGAGVRGLRAHPTDARGRRRPGRRLPALGPHRRELAPLLRAHGRRADAARRRLVRPLLRQHVRELPGAVGRQDRAAAAARRALDARREHPLPRRRRPTSERTRRCPLSPASCTLSGSTAI